MNFYKKNLIAFLFVIMLPLSLLAQNNEVITIVGDSLIGNRINNENIRKIFGNVVITQGNVRITCNKAIQYLTKNEAELIGNVVVTQDTVKITSNKGYYFGNEKYSYSNSGVTLTDGHILLTAENGYYFMNEKKAYFYGNVRLQDSLNVLISDTLTYFDKLDSAVAIGNVQVSDTSSIIYADSLIYLRKWNSSFAYNKVRLINKKNSVEIKGKKLIYLPKKKYAKITGNPILTKIDTASNDKFDTLFVTSKTMVSLGDSVKRLIAKDSVKILRNNFASRNDYAVFYKNENKILTYKINQNSSPPVLWFQNSQMSGDTIIIYLKKDYLNKIQMGQNALIISHNKTYPFRFDQISGRKIVIKFRNGNLIQTDVYKNALSIYYLYENNKPNGLLKSSAENEMIYFKNNKVDNVKMYGSPISEFHPENLIKGNEKDFTLPTFIIYSGRPIRKDFNR